MQPLETFNLIYHVTPLGNWRKNIQLLKPHLSIFNGKRIAAVAQGDGLEDVREVQKMLPDVTCSPFKNNLTLRETATFPQLLNAVYSLDPTEATFYGHTKGVTHALAPHVGPDKDKQEAVEIWTGALYHHLLARFSEVKTELEHVPVVGAYRRYGTYPHFPKGSKWHFAGTMFWFRNKELFSKKDWKIVPKERYGAEAYVGLKFPVKESHTMFIDNCGSPYSLAYQKRINRARLG